MINTKARSEKALLQFPLKRQKTTMLKGRRHHLEIKVLKALWMAIETVPEPVLASILPCKTQKAPLPTTEEIILKSDSPTLPINLFSVSSVLR